MYFRQRHICSNKLDVQETNISFLTVQQNLNHLVGHWTEIGWFACSGITGSNCFCLWKIFLMFQTERSNRKWEKQISQ